MILGVLYCVLAGVFLVFLGMKAQRKDPVPLLSALLFTTAVVGVLTVIDVDAATRVWVGISLVGAALVYMMIYGEQHGLYVAITVLLVIGMYAVASIIVVDVIDNTQYAALVVIVLILVIAWVKKLDASIERKVRER